MFFELCPSLDPQDPTHVDLEMKEMIVAAISCIGDKMTRKISENEEIARLITMLISIENSFIPCLVVG